MTTIDEIMRRRNDKMRPQAVINFYAQALYNNRRWLEQAQNENDKAEIKRISTFIERGEREISHARERLQKEREKTR